MGMPIMVVNTDIVQQQLTNDPGQIIPVCSGSEDVDRAIRYVNPPNFSPNFINMISSLIDNTLTQAGANDAALGDIKNPDNTPAIIATRESATMPLQTIQKRYYSFCEDIARIWEEFFVMMYGKRSLKIEDDDGVWYMPFDGDRYKDVVVSTRIDVGASSLWSESQSITTLGNLFDRQIIDPIQYLSRLPKGTIPNVSKLIKELKEANAAAQEAVQKQVAGNADPTQKILAGLTQEQQAQFAALDDNTKSSLLSGQIPGSLGGEA